MIRRGCEILVVDLLAVEIHTAPAHRDGDNAGLLAGPGDGGHEVAVAGGLGLDQKDVSLGGDGMGPFDVEGLLKGPAASVFTLPWGVAMLRTNFPEASLLEIPKVLSNVFKSLVIVGSLKASTMAMVWPAPVAATLLLPEVKRT